MIGIYITAYRLQQGRKRVFECVFEFQSQDGKVKNTTGGGSGPLGTGLPRICLKVDYAHTTAEG